MKVSTDMAKDVDRSFNHPLPGGLSLLSMDFSSTGISWADNIYQKWGNICVDNILSQKPCKYVGVFGKHFRRMLDEVADDWLNHSDDYVQGPVSDLSLEHNVISEVCKKSRLGFDDLDASSNGVNHVAQCVEDSNCETSENLDENLDSDCSDAGAGTIECLDGLSREEEGIVGDVVDLNMESIEDFEDVNIQDILDDIETPEFNSISQQTCKKASYKRKFIHAFYSKIRSGKKDKDEIVACFTENDLKKQDTLGNAASEISSRKSFEADWEIL